MNAIRIFISSPGDVAEERERARQVVQGLRRRYARHFELVPVFWEDMPLGLDASFQEGIDVLISNDSGVDIAVFILWSRLGSALGARFARADGREYRSGTERELDLMLEARAAQAGKRPHILAYARQDEATFEEQLRGKSTDEKEELLKQKKLVESFIREEFYDETTGTNLRAYHTYHGPQSFSERLRVHLQEIVDGLSAGRSGRPAWEIDQRGPPFVGLESFRYEQAEVFFGREDEVSEARLRLAAAARRGTPFLLVSGASGSGKSSLAAAGLLPEIVAYETDETVSRWLHAVCTPAAFGGDPAAGIGRVLAQAVPAVAARGDAEDLVDGLREGPVVTVKLALLPALKAEASTAGGVRLVLLVDQLEELFTDPRLSDEAREQFARILAALCSSGQVWVVATIRGDFYHRLLDCPELVRLVTDGAQFPLGPPGVDALRRMIESPAMIAGLSYEQTGEITLADRILRDVSGQAELLPLLEDLLRELFEKRSAEDVLTRAAYESLGGIEGALARRAEESLARLPADVQAAFPDVMHRLVATGDGPDGVAVRRRVPIESFAAGSPARVLVDALVADRLLTASAGEDGIPEVSIAHEALLRVWPRAAAWIRENLEFLKLRDRLSARMREESPLSAADPLVPAARAALDARPNAFEPDLAAYVTAQLAAIAAEKRRQVRRRRMLVAVAAATLVAVSLGGLALQARADRQRRAAEAAGAVFALERAGSGQIATAATAATRPELAALARPRLEEAFRGVDAAADPAKKLRAAIGMVRLPSVNDEAWTYLAESLLVAEPDELAEIRDALAPQKARFVELFWQRARGEERAERLRAAAALAAFDPDGAGWPAIAPAVAGDLVAVPAVHLADWLAALAPMRRVLVPALVPIFADPARREVERSLAADILADYAADDPAVLADLTMTAEPKQFPAIARQVEARFAAVAPLLEAEIARSLPEELPAADPARETLGMRQAKAAAVLVRFGRPERVWPLFVHSPDPRVRSYLIHFLGPFGASGEPVAERLAVEPDISARRGLVLALGELLKPGAGGGRETAAAELRGRLVPELREMFVTDPDPGLHAATEWTLRECGDAEWLAAWQDAWREKDGDPAPPRMDAILREFSSGAPREPRWFVNSQGQSFVAVPGPVEFLMGSFSPEGTNNLTTAGHRVNAPFDFRTKVGHRRRIGRSFAVAVKTVTNSEWIRLMKQGPPGIPEGPRRGVSWLDAAQYCNALSAAEGIPEHEWVYQQDETGSIRLEEGWLARSGYRLPTESEWEYTSRAGAVTRRFYGEAPDLLGFYSWYFNNSAIGAPYGRPRSWEVWRKKPNDLGLFDALGHVWNLCQGPYGKDLHYDDNRVIEDEEGALEIVVNKQGVLALDKHRVMRGGSFDSSPSDLQSGHRINMAPPPAEVFMLAFVWRGHYLPAPVPP